MYVHAEYLRESLLKYCPDESWVKVRDIADAAALTLYQVCSSFGPMKKGIRLENGGLATPNGQTFKEVLT